MNKFCFEKKNGLVDTHGKAAPFCTETEEGMGGKEGKTWLGCKVSKF